MIETQSILMPFITTYNIIHSKDHQLDTHSIMQTH